MAQDPLKYFRPEAADLVAQMAAGFLELEKKPDDASLIAKLFRLAHTLKGAARIVKHKPLAELAHALETWMAPLREAGGAPAKFDEALQLVDKMTAEVAALHAPVPAPAAAAAAPKPTGTTIPIPLVTSGVPAPVFAVERTDLGEVLDGLAELQQRLAQLRSLDDLRVLPARVEQLERELRRVRDDAEQLQLVPARALFAPLERMVRDSGAAIDLITNGGEVRIEAAVLAVLHGALVQLVRNALAHGFESAAQRRAAGKRERGTLSLELVPYGARVTVTCRDDGRGIDLAAVHAKLAQRGGDVPARGDHPAIMRALLAGGISTAASVTELSGRGVGLDVVRDAAAQLGGELAATTELGAGTAFTITVPVSLATLRALSVSSGDTRASVPLASVRRVTQVRPEHIVATDRARAFVEGDVSLPYARLDQVLGGAARPTAAALVLDGAVLGVEQVLGVHDIVHRARPAGLDLAAMISGLALDGDGVPRPVFDAAELARVIAAVQVEPEVVRPRPPPILVIDDSLTTRMLEQAILEGAGYDVELASSAEEGYAKAEARAGRYALFLVDVEMPGMDGFTFVERTRAHPVLGRIPAILVTSRNAPEDRRRGLDAGASGYMIKGELDQKALLALIARLV